MRRHFIIRTFDLAEKQTFLSLSRLCLPVESFTVIALRKDCHSSKKSSDKMYWMTLSIHVYIYNVLYSCIQWTSSCSLLYLILTEVLSAEPWCRGRRHLDKKLEFLRSWESQSFYVVLILTIYVSQPLSWEKVRKPASSSRRDEMNNVRLHFKTTFHVHKSIFCAS